MFKQILGLLVLLAVFSFLLPADAHARSGDRIRCDSRDFRDNYCPVYGGAQVYLHRQRSRAQCIQGVSWGFDGRGVWVSQGCHGEFGLRGGRAGVSSTQRQYDHRYQQRGYRDDYRDRGHYSDDRFRGAVIRCESNEGRTRYCGVYRGQIDLARQLSRASCVYGRSWGVDRRGLWVSNGCRAEFFAR